MLNQDKCHFIFWGHKHKTLFVNVGEGKNYESKKQKLLGVLIDRDLKFDEYVLSKCKRADNKLSALIWKSGLMTFEQRRNMMKGFIETQFGYHPLALMFYGKQTNVRINHIHKRTLKAVCNYERSPFE